MKKVKLSDGRERIVLDTKKDNCPICDTPLKNVAYRWQMFHGEAEADCCGAIFQIKSWYVDPKKYAQDIVDFSNSLNEPNKVYLKIGNDWIEPIKAAIKELGISNIHQDEVYDIAKKHHEKSAGAHCAQRTGLCTPKGSLIFKITKRGKCFNRMRTKPGSV